MPADTLQTINETCAQTAKRVRQALKAKYPGVKFSVRSSTYSGGASIDVSYTDGPAQHGVYVFLQQFAGCDFDGMTDMKTYRDDVLFANPDGTYSLINSGANFVHPQRRISQAWREEIAAEIARVTGQPCDLANWGDIGPDGNVIKWNGAGWDSRYDAYVIDGEIVPAGDTPQTYGSDLFRALANVDR
jgi:hypothetical protein